MKGIWRHRPTGLLLRVEYSRSLGFSPDGRNTYWKIEGSVIQPSKDGRYVGFHLEPVIPHREYLVYVSSMGVCGAENTFEGHVAMPLEQAERWGMDISLRYHEEKDKRQWRKKR